MINTIDMPTADGDSFDSLLPRHEQIYEFSQLRSGRTLARVVFSLIHFGSELGQIQTELGNNTLYPSETSVDNGDFVYPGQHTETVSREHTPFKTTKPNDQYWVRVRATKRHELSDDQINGVFTCACPFPLPPHIYYIPSTRPCLRLIPLSPFASLFDINLLLLCLFHYLSTYLSIYRIIRVERA